VLKVIVINSLLLPVWACCFVVPENSKGFFVSSAGSIEIALSKFAVGFGAKKLITEVLDME
jgi:hypothetical protein